MYIELVANDEYVQLVQWWWQGRTESMVVLQYECHMHTKSWEYWLAVIQLMDIMIDPKESGWPINIFPFISRQLKIEWRSTFGIEGTWFMNYIKRNEDKGKMVTTINERLWRWVPSEDFDYVKGNEN